MIYNNTNEHLYYKSRNGVIRVFLDGKGLTKLDIGEFIQVYVPKRNYKLRLVRIDGFPFVSNHTIDVKEDKLYIEASASFIGNDVNIVKTLPLNFFRLFDPVAETPNPMKLSPNSN